MSSSSWAAAVALDEARAGFEPGRFCGADGAGLAEELAVTAKACTTAGLLAAARATKAGAHRERGFQDPASGLARQSGTTAAQAREALDQLSPDLGTPAFALCAGLPRGLSRQSRPTPDQGRTYPTLAMTSASNQVTKSR
ncbi:MAG TPA: hypothetical protein VLX59_14850 [Acidimicrobiales bacterium]|nr:hypothetical protein [Acidimicrobiales bacterium]